MNASCGFLRGKPAGADLDLENSSNSCAMWSNGVFGFEGPDLPTYLPPYHLPTYVDPPTYQVYLHTYRLLLRRKSADLPTWSSAPQRVRRGEVEG